jgi:mannonate dehydratase
MSAESAQARREVVYVDRRKFIGASAAGVAAALTEGEGPAAAFPDEAGPARMVVGHQHDHSDETLKLLAALGVTHICSRLPSRTFDESWSVDGLTRLREKVESYGIKLEAVPLPLSSAYITRAEFPSIMLGKDLDRDRDIDTLCKMIENAAKAGIPMLKYNLTLLGVVRTGRTPGRGGSTYSTFVYDQAKQDPPLTEAGPVSDEMVWERMTHFLKRVIPVAEANKVRMACHPNDPGMPKDRGFRGVHCPLGTVDGLKRFVETAKSPYHGLNFCQGTVSEMLKKPGEEIYDVIRYFGTRGKIFNVHFRNIRGGFLNFQETFPDDGDVDMLKALRTYKEVGYRGMIMPDHVPIIPGTASNREAFSYCFGYIRALLQAVEA